MIQALGAKLPNTWVVPMISFAVAVQITSFGSVEGVAFNSGMTTGNLRKTITALGRMLYGQDPEENRETFLTVGTVCLSFLLGALFGGVFTTRDRAHCLLVPLLAIPVAAFLSRARQAPTLH